MFADIVGFTAWSSTREPSQVFTLLETIYHEFDQIAKQRRVFKVETVGDCYVAVAGLPDPRKDHAMVMARFGRDCSTQMRVLTKRLEVVLGPDTADLSMRIGLHSGPVTAGVLRGERARFQLFGDTMNTASRMESTGSPGRIQVSREMADELVHAGKGHWIKPRSDKVLVKGKGEMQTYWLEVKGESNSTNGMESSASKVKTAQTDSETSSSGEGHTTQMVMEEEHSEVADEPSVVTMGNKRLTDRLQRLVNWNVDLLSRLLQEVIARRQTKGTAPDPEEHLSGLEKDILHTSENSLAEVCEIIKLPAYRPEFKLANPAAVLLSDEIIEQLRHFITMLALMYHDNPFHNFEHASHVTMSASKLLNRIVIPEDVNYQRKSAKAIASDLHDYTYGITSDPLTQFTVLFCALIHDVEHDGVSNMQLAMEQPHMADKYKNRSLAEQNSVDVAWNTLMQPEYRNLQQCIFTNEDELERFRQLVVNSVMATDIFDKESKALRNSRWDKAFHKDPQSLPLSEEETTNLKATIVIEHIIQAADVAHTMQHWHVYTKWNERLFQEMYRAYESGRSAKDPSEGWYNGELWFFDNYVIPLAKKLDECNVFGVSSDEGLNYALANRNEWAAKGKEIVDEMVQRVKQKSP
uniref:Guanylate cyclase domain-containing protein n=1 Tax=Craspedostauros australis TaxID=1486917 RepID=A0A7R9WW54_9STRA|mmetsp:Transcript_23157/g.64617  ORF Transcript_23157/g.64617 Transcript_23157/m.64617 type:complete len:637 (+) Transcript_23157:24-1934(+)